MLICPFSDNVFDESAGTDQVYSRTAQHVVQSVMEGMNATIFAYGQTSSGKTFTMNGDKSCPGIIPMAIDDIFTHIQNTPNREFLMRVSYLEIYQENLNCLLNSKKEELKISEHYERGVFVDGLLEVNVGSPQQVLECLVNGQSRRHIGATQVRSSAPTTICLEDTMASATIVLNDRPTPVPALCCHPDVENMNDHFLPPLPR